MRENGWRSMVGYPQVVAAGEGELLSDILLCGIRFVIRSNMGLYTAAGRARTV
jgi:hypothetical protein